MPQPIPSLSRLTEILNNQGEPASSGEVSAYLSPEAMQQFHVNSVVESRLRALLLSVMEGEDRWKQGMANLLRPWQAEIDAIVAAAQLAIMNHIAHAKEPRCACFREQREALWEVQ